MCDPPPTSCWISSTLTWAFFGDPSEAKPFECIARGWPSKDEAWEGEVSVLSTVLWVGTLMLIGPNLLSNPPSQFSMDPFLQSLIYSLLMHTLPFGSFLPSRNSRPSQPLLWTYRHLRQLLMSSKTTSCLVQPNIHARCCRHRYQLSWRPHVVGLKMPKSLRMYK